jgi:hypothetical protein
MTSETELTTIQRTDPLMRPQLGVEFEPNNLPASEAPLEDRVRRSRISKSFLAVSFLATSLVGIASADVQDNIAVASSEGSIPAGGTLRVNVEQAIGGKTVIGNLAATNQNGRPGFVTAFGCDDGLPKDGNGNVIKSDLNHVGQTGSNRLIVEADKDGDVCFYSSTAADLVVDVNGVSDTGIDSFPNVRTDTRKTEPGVDLGEVSLLSGSGNYVRPDQLGMICLYTKQEFNNETFYTREVQVYIDSLDSNDRLDFEMQIVSKSGLIHGKFGVSQPPNSNGVYGFTSYATVYPEDVVSIDGARLQIAKKNASGTGVSSLELSTTCSQVDSFN